MSTPSKEGAQISSLFSSSEVLTDPTKGAVKVKAVVKDNHDTWLPKSFDVLTNREVYLPNAYIEVVVPIGVKGLSRGKLHERLVKGATALSISGYNVLTAELTDSFIYRIVRK